MDPDILVGIFIGLIIWFLVRYLCAQGGKGPSTHLTVAAGGGRPPCDIYYSSGDSSQMPAYHA
jgi:hypothetical protein